MIDFEQLKSLCVLEGKEREEALDRRFTKVAGTESRIVRALEVVPTGGTMTAAKIEVETLRAMVTKRGMPWLDAYPDRAVRFIGSTEMVDSYGDIVRQNFNFRRWDSNAPMPHTHNTWGDPLGQHIHWDVETVTLTGYRGRALTTIGLFAPEDANPIAERVLKLVRLGFMRGSSIGFIPGEVIQVRDPEERNKLGLGQWGVILDKNELLELSPCMIGSNPGASVQLSVAAKAGHIKAADLVVFREFLRIGPASNDDWQRQDGDICSVARFLFSEERNLFGKAKDRGQSLLEERDQKPRIVIPPRARAEDASSEAPADAAPKESPELAEIKQLRADFSAFADTMVAAINATNDRLDEMNGVESVEDDSEPETTEEGKSARSPNLLVDLFAGRAPKETK